MKTLVSIAFLATIFSFCRSDWAAQKAFPASQRLEGSWLSAVQRAEIDRLFARPPKSPGYAVAVIEDGEFAVRKGYGLADLDDGIPITPETSFHLASLSKQFTGAAIALLILEHRVALTDPVAKYIPEVAKYGDGLRIEHLLYMTSGLHEYMDVPRRSGDPWATFYYFTRDEAIRAALRPAHLEFTPGARWAYRNINYMLLTKIVEVVSHQSFSAFMRDRIFGPLGMAHTEIDDDTTEVIPHRATGYAPRSDPKVARELASVGVFIKPGAGWVRLVRVSPHFGGSGVFTTTDDLLLWDRNWYTGTLAGPAFTRLMNRRQRFQYDKDNDAFGLVWRTRYGHPMLDYSGADIDTSTYMARFPAQRLTVVCLSNMPLGDAESKADALLDLLHGWGKL
ncbi:MAG TPA: serine hydrolase domain-containing protein [Steroidobacteraceae bacterium]|jgi:CubicO group peptidase (beta-lactamase class C family)|nr:serine hydrolase domain-containing protein [Steroidobacteraceae bacterium]